MENKKTRFLALVLAVVMIVGMLPAQGINAVTMPNITILDGDGSDDVHVNASANEDKSESTPSATITGTISEDMVWKNGDIVNGVTISGGTAEDPIEITLDGTVTVTGTIRMSPDSISHVVFKSGSSALSRTGTEAAMLIRGSEFTGQMFYVEGVSGNFQNLTFDNIVLDGGAVWTGEVDATLNRGKTNSGVKATGSVLYLVYANAKLNYSTLQNHDDSTGQKANAVFLRYYSTIEFNDSVVRNNNSISTYYRGGVVTVRQGGTVKTNNADVYGNSAPSGGFFSISSTGSFGGVAEAYNSKFHNNYADNGAVFLMQCNSKRGYLKIDGCEFYNNASNTAVLSEWAYSRPFIISNSSFYDNECAVWDCHSDPVLDLSGKIVVKEDADYSKYLFETPLVLSGALAEGSSIAMSEATITKLMASGYLVTGTAGYQVTEADLAKLVMPDDYLCVVVDKNSDGIGEIVALDLSEVESVEKIILTLKDAMDASASATGTVYVAVECLPVCPFAHTGYVFAGWVDAEGNLVVKQKFTATATLTATWKLETPVVQLSRDNATLKATVSNMNEAFTYTYQWYKGGVAIDGATSSTYTMTDVNSASYKCEVTVSDGKSSVTGSVSGNSSAPAAAQVGDTKYGSLKEAIDAANAIEGGATVALLQDITLGEKLTITGNVTISGGKITRADTYTGTLFTVNAGATLTLDGGLVIDGGNEWFYTNGTPELDMKNGAGTKVGHHITPAEGGVNATAHLIVNGGTLNAKDVTIQNSYSTNGVSAIQCDANSVTVLDGAKMKHIAANRSGAVVNVGGADAVLTIKGDTQITDNFGISNGGIIQNYGQGTTVNMEGGSIDHNYVGNSGTVYASYSGNANKINTFNMSGGIITQNVMEGYGPVYIHTNTVWNMTGGEISYNTSFLPTYVRSKNNAATISGGKILNNTITGTSYSSGYYVTRPDIYLGTNSKIVGGTFTQDVSEWLVPNTGLAYDAETKTYSVVTEELFKLHLTNPTTGETSVLMGNNMGDLIALAKQSYAGYKMELEILYSVKIDETVVVDCPMTINLNGKTITTVLPNGAEYMDAFTILADVTVIGEGKVNARPSCGYVFYVGDKNGTAGNLTIESGTFYGETSVVQVTDGKLIVNGGNFAVTPYEESYEFTLNCLDANYKNGTAQIIVKGGKFYKFNPADNKAEGAGTNYCADRYVAEADGDLFIVRKLTEKAIKVTVTVNNATMVAGNEYPQFSYTTDVADVPALNITYTVDGTTINATVAKMEGYEFTVKPGTLTVEEALIRVYGTNNAKVKYFASLQEAMDYATAQSDYVPIYLLGNITIDEPVVIQDSNNNAMELQSVKVGGNTLKLTSTFAGPMFVLKSGKLGVKNVIIDAKGDAFQVTGGELNLNSHSAGSQFIEITSQTDNCIDVSGGTVNVNGAKLTALGTEPAIKVTGTGKVNIAKWNIGTILPNVTAPNADKTIETDDENSVSIQYGTFDEDVTAYCAEGHKATQNADGTWTVGKIITITVDNQTVVAGNSFDVTTWTYKVSEEIKGMSVTLMVNGYDGFTAGTYAITATATEPSDMYCFEVVEGKLTVQTAVCAIGDVNYASLADAVKAVPKGAGETTIKLLVSELKINSIMVGHTYAQKITIDLNGGKLYSTDKTLTAYRAGTVLTLINGTVSGNTTGGTLVATYGGKLVLGENLKVTAGGQANAIRIDNATLVIDSSVEVSAGKNWLVATADTRNTVTISQGDFTGTMSVGTGTNIQLSGGWYTVEPDQAWCADGYSVHKYQDLWTVGKGILTVDGVWYESMADAMPKIYGDSIIVLFADVENKGSFSKGAANKILTLDLNGHKFTTTTIGVDGHKRLHIVDSAEGGSVQVTNYTALYANGYLDVDSDVNFNSKIQFGYHSAATPSTGCLLIDGEKWIGRGHFQQEDGIIGMTGGYVTISDTFQNFVFQSGSFYLTKDAVFNENATITINKDVSIDLKGKNLTAKSIKGFGTLIDSEDGVGTVSAELSFYGHNNGGYIPLKDETGYRLFKIVLDNRGARDTTDDKNGNPRIQVGFTIRFNKAEAYDLLIASVKAQNAKLEANAEFADGDSSALAFPAASLIKHLEAARGQLENDGTVKSAITGKLVLGESAVTFFAALKSETGVVIESETESHQAPVSFEEVTNEEGV